MIGLFDEKDVLQCIGKSKKSILISYDLISLIGLDKKEKQFSERGWVFKEISFKKEREGDIFALFINDEIVNYFFEWTSLCFSYNDAFDSVCHLLSTLNRKDVTNDFYSKSFYEPYSNLLSDDECSMFLKYSFTDWTDGRRKTTKKKMLKKINLLFKERKIDIVKVKIEYKERCPRCGKIVNDKYFHREVEEYFNDDSGEPRIFVWRCD